MVDPDPNPPAAELPSTWPLAKALCQQLQEKNPYAKREVHRLIQTRGLEWAQLLLQETLDCEARGGMLVPNGSRRRTPGGVFLHLAKGRLTQEERKAVFKPPRPPKAPPAPPAATTTPEEPPSTG